MTDEQFWELWKKYGQAELDARRKMVSKLPHVEPQKRGDPPFPDFWNDTQVASLFVGEEKFVAYAAMWALAGAPGFLLGAGGTRATRTASPGGVWETKPCPRCGGIGTVSIQPWEREPIQPSGLKK